MLVKANISAILKVYSYGRAAENGPTKSQLYEFNELFKWNSVLEGYKTDSVHLKVSFLSESVGHQPNTDPPHHCFLNLTCKRIIWNTHTMQPVPSVSYSYPQATRSICPFHILYIMIHSLLLCFPHYAQRFCFSQFSCCCDQKT